MLIDFLILKLWNFGSCFDAVFLYISTLCMILDKVCVSLNRKSCNSGKMMFDLVSVEHVI